MYYIKNKIIIIINRKFNIPNLIFPFFSVYEKNLQKIFKTFVGEIRLIFDYR